MNRFVRVNVTEDDQQNIAFNAPSLTGESYLALEVSEYFPKEDVDIHSYVSPTAFFHELRKLSTPDGKSLQDRREYVEERTDPDDKREKKIYFIEICIPPEGVEEKNNKPTRLPDFDNPEIREPEAPGLEGDEENGAKMNQGEGHLE